MSKPDMDVVTKIKLESDETPNTDGLLNDSKVDIETHSVGSITSTETVVDETRLSQSREFPLITPEFNESSETKRLALFDKSSTSSSWSSRDDEHDDENDDDYNLGDIQEDAQDASLLTGYRIYLYDMPDLNDNNSADFKKTILDDEQKLYRSHTPMLIKGNKDEVWLYGYNLDQSTILVKSKNIFPHIKFPEVVNIQPTFLKSDQVNSSYQAIYDEFAQYNIAPLGSWIMVEKVGKVIQLNEMEPTIYCGILKPYRYAAALRKNPILDSLLGSFIYREIFKQLLKTYPERRAEAMPYLVILGIAGGLQGTVLGAYAITHPNVLWDNDYRSTLVRLLWGIRDGLVVWIGLMSSTIALTLYIKPSYLNRDISDLEYWAEIVPAPFLLSVGVCLWQTAPALWKKRRSPRAEQLADFLSEFLFYHASWGIFLKETCRLSLNDSQIAASIAAGGTLIIQSILTKTVNRSHKMPYTGILYFLGVNAIYNYINDFFINPPEEHEVDNWSFYNYTMAGQGILLALQLAGSLWFTQRNFHLFVRNYISDIEVETQDNLLAIQKNRAMRAEKNVLLRKIVSNHSLYCWKSEFIASLDFNKDVPGKLSHAVILTKENQEWILYFIKESRWLKERDQIKKAKLTGMISGEFKLSAEGRVIITEANYKKVGTLLQKALTCAGFTLEEQSGDIPSVAPSPFMNSNMRSDIYLRSLPRPQITQIDRKVTADTNTQQKEPLLTSYMQHQASASSKVCADEKQDAQEPKPDTPRTSRCRDLCVIL